MEPLAIGVFLAVVNQKVIDYLAAPIRKRWPDANLWWLIYLALATGAAVAWLAGVNLFGAYIKDEMVGRVLSCVVVGGGSSLIHDVFDKV
jgi:hypothetical protein